MRLLAPLTILVATTALVATMALAAPAHAETIGGDQLAQPGRLVTLGPDAAPLPKVKAKSWLLADATTGEVLAAKDAHEQRAPASTLKTLTALTVIPQTSREQVWTATATAANQEGSRVGLRPGKDYTLKELWLAVFLPSANDAAVGVAQANGGVKKTINQMNAVAERLQAYDTVAKSTNGLDRPGQVSSAYDLALIGRAGLRLPEFAEYAATEKALFPDVKGKGQHPIYNTNRLLLSGYKGVTGLKTGFTSQAGRTFIGSATRKDTSLIVVLMGIGESTDDAARRLLTWGFKNHDKVTPVGTLVEPLAEGVAAQIPGDDDEPAASGQTPTDTSSAAAGSQGSTNASAPTSSTSAITYGGALLILAAVVAGAFALTRTWLGRTRGRHRTR